MYSGLSGQCSHAIGGECYVFRDVRSMFSCYRRGMLYIQGCQVNVMYSGVSGQCSRAIGGECYVFRGVRSMFSCYRRGMLCIQGCQVNV